MIRDREKARKAVVASANSTFRLVEDLLRHDLLRYCPPVMLVFLSYRNTLSSLIYYSQVPLFIAMIVYAEEIKLSPISSPRFNLATNKINLGMMALGELRKIWAASFWAFRMFEYIIERKFAPIGTPDITGVDGETPFISDVDFNNNDLPIDPLLTGQPPTPPQNVPSTSGHCYWNMNVDSDMPMTDQTDPAFNLSNPGDGQFNHVGDSSNDFEFDLAWMAMSGLAGDIPFHFEGAPGSKVNGKGGGGVGTGDLMSLLGLADSSQMMDNS